MNARSLLNLIDECANIAQLKQIHAKLVTTGTTQDIKLANKTIEFFKTSKNHNYPCRLLTQIQRETGSSFPINSLITSYSNSSSAILVYRVMVQHGFSPDLYTFPVVLRSCSKISGIREGIQIHGIVVKLGFWFDLYVQNGLVNMYSVCGEFGDAHKVFTEMPLRDVVSWTSLISGCVKSGLFDKGLILFSNMDVEPNAATIVSVLVGCGRLGDLRLGRGIHGLIFKREFEMGVLMGNALMDMYVKCECLDDAKQVFNELSQRDVISWTCIISGLVQCKCPKEALEFFHAMQVSGIEPDIVTLASVLSACASMGSLDIGRWIHEYIDCKGIEWDVHMGTAMVDMYAKCGSINMALHTFHQMQHKNIFTYNALLGGLAMHGHGIDVLDHFEQMLRFGVRPNEITYLAVLTACCHSGMVEEGRRHFHHMSQDHNLSPQIEHFGCMVDLLCRAGLLEEALAFTEVMPMPPDVLIWGALLSACKAKRDVETSQRILEHLVEMKCDDSGVYVLLSNIFASNDRWEDAAKVRNLMKNKGIKKHPGSSVVEIDGKVHELLVGDAKHPKREEIHVVLNMLAKQMFFEGHNLGILSSGMDSMEYDLHEYDRLILI